MDLSIIANTTNTTFNLDNQEIVLIANVGEGLNTSSKLQ